MNTVGQGPSAGLSPLWVAVQYKREAAVGILARRLPPAASGRMTDRISPLGLAVETKQLDIVHALLGVNSRVQVDAPAFEYKGPRAAAVAPTMATATALFLAAGRGWEEGARVLAHTYHANALLANAAQGGKTPIEIACERGYGSTARAMGGQCEDDKTVADTDAVHDVV